MKTERIRLRVKENAEITVRDRGGKFGVICFGPGWVEVEMRKKATRGDRIPHPSGRGKQAKRVPRAERLRTEKR